MITDAVSENAGNMGRRSAVIAATSGLAFTMGIPASNASPSGESTDAQQVGTALPPTTPAGDPAVGVIAKPTPEHTPTVSVPEDLVIDLGAATVTAVTPPPAPSIAEAARNAAAGSTTETPARSASSPAAAPARQGDDTPASDTAKPEKVPTTSASGKRGQVLSIAARYLGVPYRWGGTTPKGFDCSGYVQYVYKQVGVSLPRTSGAQAKAGKKVSASQARPGDLVWKPGHIGIYAGNGMMYDAPRRGKPVQKRKIYFKPVYIRVL